MITGGHYDGVSYEVYHWGVVIYTLDKNDNLVHHKYAGNGTDPILINEVVKDFKERFDIAD